MILQICRHFAPGRPDAMPRRRAKTTDTDLTRLATHGANSWRLFLKLDCRTDLCIVHDGYRHLSLTEFPP